MQAVRALFGLTALAAAIVGSVAVAEAAIDFTWSFDAPLPVITNGTESLDMPATLVVAADSDQFTFGGTSLNIGVGPGNLGLEYVVSAFGGLTGSVNPGDTLHFIFSTISPAAPDFAAAPGDYIILSASITGFREIPGDGLEQSFVNPSNLFSARVVVDGAVPEPGTFLLLGTGMIGLAWRRVRRR